VKLGWLNTTTEADRADLSETWALFYRGPDGGIWRQTLGFTRTNTANPLTEADRQEQMAKVEARVREAGGIF
jgi:hypothetical protein